MHQHASLVTVFVCVHMYRCIKSEWALPVGTEYYPTINRQDSSSKSVTVTYEKGRVSLTAFQCRDLVEEGVDPFEENIQNMYYTADPQGKGYITREEFISVSSWPNGMVVITPPLPYHSSSSWLSCSYLTRRTTPN